MGVKFRRFLNQGRKGHTKYSIHERIFERSRGEDPVYFLPLTISFSTAVQTVSAMPSKPPITYAGLAERE